MMFVLWRNLLTLDLAEHLVFQEQGLPGVLLQH